MEKSITSGMLFDDAQSILALAQAKHIKTVSATEGHTGELYELLDGRQIYMHVIKKGAFISSLEVIDPPVYPEKKGAVVRSVSITLPR